MILNPIKADCVIFDVDGVLIDTSHSFVSVVSDCVAFAWKTFLKRTVDIEFNAGPYFLAAKQYSRYNDDYDLAWCLASMMAASDADRLSEAILTLESWTNQLDAAGDQGIQAFAAKYGAKIPYKPMRRVCAEDYYGTKTLVEAGYKPIYLSQAEGRWHMETSALHINWRNLPLPVGIYSGRMGLEMKLALHLLQWDDFPPAQLVTADQFQKPDPKGLEKLCQTLGCNCPLYFGDTASDQATQAAFGHGNFVAVGPILESAEIRFPDVADAVHALLGTS